MVRGKFLLDLETKAYAGYSTKYVIRAFIALQATIFVKIMVKRKMFTNLLKIWKVGRFWKPAKSSYVLASYGIWTPTSNTQQEIEGNMQTVTCNKHSMPAKELTTHYNPHQFKSLFGSHKLELQSNLYKKTNEAHPMCQMRKNTNAK